MCKALALCCIVSQSRVSKTKALHLCVLLWCIVTQRKPSEMYVSQGKVQGMAPRPAARLSVFLLPEMPHQVTGRLWGEGTCLLLRPCCIHPCTPEIPVLLRGVQQNMPHECIVLDCLKSLTSYPSYFLRRKVILAIASPSS